MGQMLGQRVDPDQVFAGPSAAAFGAELGLTLAGPFKNEPQRARWDPPSISSSVSIAVSATCSP
jgi:hypothetical protein